MQQNKLKELRAFVISLSHKALKLTASNWVHFETVSPLSDRIQANTDRFNKFGLTDDAELNVAEIQGSVNAIVKYNNVFQEQFEEQTKTPTDSANDIINSINRLNQLQNVVGSLLTIARYHKYMKAMHEQYNRLDKVDDMRFDILDAAAEIPIVQLKAREADAAIQRLRNQNGLLNDHIKELQAELATRPTLAIVKQEIGKYASGGRISSSTTVSGLQGVTKLEKAVPKFFWAFHTQFKHYAQVCNWSPEMEALLSLYHCLRIFPMKCSGVL